MNKEIKSRNEENSKGRQMKEVSEREWWCFIGIIIAACPAGKGGSKLLGRANKKDAHRTFSEPTDLGPNGGMEIMPKYRFDDIVFVFPHAFFDLGKPDDPWHKIGLLVDGFNENRRRVFAPSHKIVFDESMSAWKPRTTKEGGLPNISFIMRKPKPLGTELKNAACTETGTQHHRGFRCLLVYFEGVMVYVEVQRGKDGMATKQYNSQFGATAGCSLRLVEASAYCGQDNQERIDAKEQGKKLQFEADSWFMGTTFAEQLSLRGHEGGGPVKTNSRFYPKDELEKIMKHWPHGSKLALKCVTPRNGITLFAEGYKYNNKKVLCFIFTEGAGPTTDGEPYVMRFPSTFGNVMTRNVPRPANISNYFRTANMIDAHNQVCLRNDSFVCGMLYANFWLPGRLQARQHDLGLEELWRTTNAWFRIDTTFIGITTTDAWKCFRYGRADNDSKELPIKEFADRVAYDLINNVLSTKPPVNDVSSVSADSQDTSRQATLASTRAVSQGSEGLAAAIVEHAFAKTTQQEQGIVKRSIRKTCQHEGCTARSNLECTNESCKATWQNTNGKRSYGVFYCQEHIGYCTIIWQWTKMEIETVMMRAVWV